MVNGRHGYSAVVGDAYRGRIQDHGYHHIRTAEYGQVNQLLLAKQGFGPVKERIADCLRKLDSEPVTGRSPYSKALTAAEEAAILDRLSLHVGARPGDRKPFLFRLEGPGRDRRAQPRNPGGALQAAAS